MENKINLSQPDVKHWTKMNKEELKAEFLKCKRDKAYFISTYVKVEHQLLGLVPFELFDFQRRIIDNLDKNRFNLLRKFRQAGCTTIACAYALHILVFERNKTIAILSIGDTESTEVLTRIKIMYDELPSFLKPAIKKGGDNKHTLELVTGCKVKARPAKKTSGRSLSSYLLIIDEAAFVESIGDIWAAVYPIISTGGRVFMLSTVNGMGNFFHTMYEEARKGLNNFNVIDIDWQEHPQYKYDSRYEWLYSLLRERDDTYDVNHFEEATKKNIGIKRWKQEFEKEFLGTGETYIDGETLTLLNDNTSKEYTTKYNNRLRVWHEPEPYHQYVMGADTALGRERDYSAFIILNVYNGQQVAEFYSNKTSIDDFAKILSEEGRRYNSALIMPERNSIGNNLIEYLVKKEQYENVWMDKNGKYGFQTTFQSKEQLFAKMEEYIRSKKILVNSDRLVKELLTFVIDESGRVKADNGQHDDLIMSLALSIQGIVEMITNSPGTLTKLSDDGFYEPMPMFKGNNQDMRKYFGGKTYDEIKWVYGK
jgi:hypothetical protein